MTVATPELSGNVIVVAGAAGAQGSATARAFAGAGATVVAAGRDAQRLADVVAIDPSRIVASTVDFADASATDRWAKGLLDQHGRVDGLMHLVGGWRGGKGIVESDLEDWNVLHDSLIRTLQHTTRALHDALLASPHGRVAIVSTTGLEQPKATNAAYLAAKAASETWVRAVADSFVDSDAAAVVGRVMALVTPQMQEKKPDGYKKFTPVGQVADWMLDLYARPAAAINGAIETIMR